MSNATRNQGGIRRLQPYAWLGVSAVTLGMGAAMVGGTAVAFADPGAAASDTAASDTSSATPKADVAKKPASRGSRLGATDAPASAGAKGRAIAASADATAPRPAAATAVAPQSSVATAVAPQSSVATAVAPRVARGSQQGASAAQPVAAAATKVAAAAADPSYNMTSYLPAAPIVPGAHVTLALQQIADAKTELNQQTFGSGKTFAGMAAIGPQLFLSEAAMALKAWQTNMPKAQQTLAKYADVPIMHQIAQTNLQITMALPTLAQAGLSGAALLMPLVNILGAATASTEALISQARSNGTVYVKVPVTMKANTEPVVYISVNGGKKVPVLLDTGSSGLVLTQDSVGSANLGPATGSGTSGYSGGLTYDYTTYDTTVDFGSGAVTSPTGVNIVDAADAQAFKDYLAPAGVVGVLGVGANTAGPGPSIPTTSLPGELSDGFTLHQNKGLFGFRGELIFGPNPYPVRVSVPGAPDAYVKVSINDGPKQNASAIIDTGGVYGTLPDYLIGGGSSVPNGTKISVYNGDGSVLLYSYTVNATNAPTVVDPGQLMNTGYEAFQHGPVYINYAADAAPGGIGSTDYVYT